MADHTPRLCIHCLGPLSAAEKRLKYPWLCKVHRILHEIHTSLVGGGFWT